MRSLVRCLASVPARSPPSLAEAAARSDPGHRNFFDLLMLPSKSAEWAERELSAQVPHSHDDFFRHRSVSASGLSELLRLQAFRSDGPGALASLRRLQTLPGAAPVTWVHYNRVLFAFAGRGDAASFDALWREAVAAGLGAGDEYTFSSAAKCYMRAGDAQRALGVVQASKEAGVKPTEVLYGALLSGFAHLGDWFGADAVWGFLRTTAGAPKLDSVLYTAMIHACGKCGKAEKALALLEEMKEEGIVATDVTYNAVLHAVARRVDMWQDAKALFASMRVAGMEPTEHTMNTLLLCAAKCGDVASCRSIVADVARMGGGCRVSLLTLNTQLNGVAAALRTAPPDERNALLREADEIFARIEREFGADRFSRLAKLRVFCSGRYLKRAQELFQELKGERGLQHHTMMLRMWCEAGRPQELSAAWSACQTECKPDAIAYRWVLEGLARAYWVNSAVDVLTQMVQRDKLVPDNRHVKILFQRCGEEDLRKQRAAIAELVASAGENKKVQLQRDRNASERMRQQLAGDGVRSFLLPFPLADLRATQSTKF